MDLCQPLASDYSVLGLPSPTHPPPLPWLRLLNHRTQRGHCTGPWENSRDPDTGCAPGRSQGKDRTHKQIIVCQVTCALSKEARLECVPRAQRKEHTFSPTLSWESWNRNGPWRVNRSSPDRQQRQRGEPTGRLKYVNALSLPQAPSRHRPHTCSQTLCPSPDHLQLYPPLPVPYLQHASFCPSVSPIR